LGLKPSFQALIFNHLQRVTPFEIIPCNIVKHFETWRTKTHTSAHTTHTRLPKRQSSLLLWLAADDSGGGDIPKILLANSASLKSEDAGIGTLAWQTLPNV
jgi:hypothetical protein